MAQVNSHLKAVFGDPKPVQIDSLFSRYGSGYGYTSQTTDTSGLLQQLMQEINTQGSEISALAGAVTGKTGGSALESVLGGTAFGGSALGGIASAAQGGFSWESLLKDVFPIGGLISGIAGLFDSAPKPPVLNEYAAPPSLDFNAVLNSNGTLSQGSDNQYGQTRASGTGLDLTDAEGGPYSPYTRSSTGSLVPVAGNPVTAYSGVLNLPELIQPLVQSAQSTSSNPATPANFVPTSAISPAATSSPQVTNTSKSLTADPMNAVPTFDQQWFNDHGSEIASAVRAQLLNFHPIVDTINDL